MKKYELLALLTRKKEEIVCNDPSVRLLEELKHIIMTEDLSSYVRSRRVPEDTKPDEEVLAG